MQGFRGKRLRVGLRAAAFQVRPKAFYKLFSVETSRRETEQQETDKPPNAAPLSPNPWTQAPSTLGESMGHLSGRAHALSSTATQGLGYRQGFFVRECNEASSPEGTDDHCIYDA